MATSIFTISLTLTKTEKGKRLIIIMISDYLYHHDNDDDRHHNVLTNVLSC